MHKVRTKLKVIFFILLLSGIWIIVENVLQVQKFVDWNMKGTQKVIEKPGYYDILFSGTSMSITNISAEELYLKHGIAGISLGEPEQTTYLSYYTIENALKYQSPKVVLYDVKALFYTEDRLKEMIEQNEDYYVHYTLDDIKNANIKLKAVEQVKKLHPESNYWQYFSKMYHNHSNWENVNEQNFKVIQGNDFILESKNSAGIWENALENNYVSEDANTHEISEIPEINKKYLKKMAELCKKHNVNLVLIRSTGSQNWSWSEYNAVKKIANELHLEYLDLALYEEKIGFDWTTDSFDGTHHNIIGTKKWTDFLGEYLTNNYEFVDRRGDERYAEYEIEKSNYESTVKVMNQQIYLSKAINFNQYLDALYNLDKEGNTIFISVNDDASASLNEYGEKMLEAIGFNINLIGNIQYSYYGVMDNGKMVAACCNKNGGEWSGKLNDGTLYQIASGGLLSSQIASIQIDGQEKIQGGRGFNIVVYNKEKKRVISSVFFDTNIEENPKTSRKNALGQIEEEEEINYWVVNRSKV